MDLAALKQRGAVSGLIGSVESLIAAQQLRPAETAHLLRNANDVCREFGMQPVRQDNISDEQADELEAEIRRIMAGAV